jgi:hypothetical protein
LTSPKVQKPLTGMHAQDQEDWSSSGIIVQGECVCSLHTCTLEYTGSPLYKGVEVKSPSKQVDYAKGFVVVETLIRHCRNGGSWYFAFCAPFRVWCCALLCLWLMRFFMLEQAMARYLGSGPVHSGEGAQEEEGVQDKERVQEEGVEDGGKAQGGSGGAQESEGAQEGEKSQGKGGGEEDGGGQGNSDEDERVYGDGARGGERGKEERDGGGGDGGGVAETNGGFPGVDSLGPEALLNVSTLTKNIAHQAPKFPAPKFQCH